MLFVSANPQCIVRDQHSITSFSHFPTLAFHDFLLAAHNEHRSALRGTSRFGFAGVLNALNIELSIFKHKERARVSPLQFSWALFKQRKRNEPPLRNRLGSLAAVGLVLARCARS